MKWRWENHSDITFLMFLYSINSNKIIDVMDSEDDYHELQLNLDHLRRLAEEWQMGFNSDKCEVLHFERSNQGRTFIVHGRTLMECVL